MTAIPGGESQGDLFKDSSSMDQAEINNWQTIAESMEAKGDTETVSYTHLTLPTNA